MGFVWVCDVSHIRTYVLFSDVFFCHYDRNNLLSYVT